MQIAGTDFVKNGESVQPTQVKIEVVMNYPPQTGEPAGVVTALEVKMRTKSSMVSPLCQLAAKRKRK